MEESLGFFRAFELWIYLLLGVGGLIYIRKFILAWQELREAAFGLERENAQTRLNQAASILVLLLTMAVVEFVLVSFIAPAIPGAAPLPTATLNLLATVTTTLPAPLPGQTGEASAPQATFTGATPIPGCIPGQIEIIFPENNQEVSGIVAIAGSANIPNFGFYKFVVRRPDETAWLTIQAGNAPVTTGKLGDWDTSRLTPGEYQLGLIVQDNQARDSVPCVIQLRVARAPDITPAP
jgi:hypothetical protein